MSAYSLKITPEQVESALGVLQEYVRERQALLGIDSEKQVEFKQVKLRNSVEAIRLMDAFYRFKEDMQSQVKTPAEQAYDHLRFTVIPQMLETEGVSSVSVAGVGRTNLQDDVQVKVNDATGLRAWLIEHEFEDMIKPSVNAQTLAAFVRRRVKEGQDLPTDCIEVKPIVRAVITRAGQGKDI